MKPGLLLSLVALLLGACRSREPRFPVEHVVLKGATVVDNGLLGWSSADIQGRFVDVSMTDGATAFLHMHLAARLFMGEEGAPLSRGREALKQAHYELREQLDLARGPSRSSCPSPARRSRTAARTRSRRWAPRW